MDSEKNLRKNFYVFPREWVTKQGKKRKVYLVQFRDPRTGKLRPAKSSRLSNETAAENWASLRWAEISGEFNFTQGMTEEARNLAAGSCADFYKWFWAEDSDYVKNRKDANKELSGRHLKYVRYYVERFVKDYVPFQETTLANLSVLIIELFMKDLKAQGTKVSIINHALDAIRTPTNWALNRGLIHSKFKFSGIVRPKEDIQERGVFTEAEVRKILELKALPLTMPRPRLPGGPRPETDEFLDIDIRMKAAVLFGIFGGLRRSDARGLKWQAIDLERKIFYARASYTDEDGWKPQPKAGSFGIIPLADDFVPVIKELLKIAKKYKRAGPEDYVLFDYDNPKVPIAEKAIRRGFDRILKRIGITNEERKRRNLVFHGTRHAFATKLGSALGSQDAMKFTRHKSDKVFQEYAGHVQPETIEKARKALRMKKEKPSGKRKGN